MLLPSIDSKNPALLSEDYRHHCIEWIGIVSETARASQPTSLRLAACKSLQASGVLRIALRGDGTEEYAIDATLAVASLIQVWATTVSTPYGKVCEQVELKKGNIH